MTDMFREFIRENKESWVNLGPKFHKRKLIMKAYFGFLCEQFCTNELYVSLRLSLEILNSV